ERCRGMSFFTDIVVVSQKEAKRVSRQTSPTSKWPGCEGKNLDQVTLGTLYGILVGDTDADVEFEDISFSKEGMWVSRFPDDYVERLSQLDTKSLPWVAKKWSKTAELRDLYEAAELQQFLEELSALA